MNNLEVKACAKINLGLRIISKRADGFHNLETIFYPIDDLFDVLTFEKANTFSFKSNNDSITNDDSNLIVNAKNILEKITNKKLSVRIFLQKNIPIGAGLGGGSSDAATTLNSLNEIFNLGLNYDILVNLALELGSDVPYFIKHGTAIGKQRGEILNYFPNQFRLPILLVNPGIHISTKEAFQNIQPKMCNINYEELVGNFTNLNYLKENLKNDFELSIFNSYSAIKDIKYLMLENGAKLSLMSGTGSTVFGIFNNLEEAETAYNLFPPSYFKFISCP